MGTHACTGLLQGVFIQVPPFSVFILIVAARATKTVILIDCSFNYQMDCDKTGHLLMFSSFLHVFLLLLFVFFGCWMVVVCILGAGVRLCCSFCVATKHGYNDKLANIEKRHL